LNRKRVFIDTWGWTALGHQKDNRHQEIVGLYKEILTDDKHFLQIGMGLRILP